MKLESASKIQIIIYKGLISKTIREETKDLPINPKVNEFFTKSTQNDHIDKSNQLKWTSGK